MDVTYGEDEVYIRLGSGKVARSHEVAPGIVLDLGDDGEAIGLEVLGLRRRGLRSGQVGVSVAVRKAGHEAEERRLAGLLAGEASQAS